MAVLQALLTFISKSAGRIINAVFGWTVNALFGRSLQTERAFLSALVAAAAAWPLLVAGIVTSRTGRHFTVSYYSSTELSMASGGCSKAPKDRKNGWRTTVINGLRTDIHGLGRELEQGG